MRKHLWYFAYLCWVETNIGYILVRVGDFGRAAQPVALAEEAAGAMGNGPERARPLLEDARLQLDCTVGRGRIAG